MTPRSMIGAVLAVAVTGAVAIGSTAAPSYTQPATSAPRAAPTAQGDPQGRADAISAAEAYLGRSGAKAPKGLSVVDVDFARAETNAGSAGTQYVAYERTFRGLRVVGGDFVLAVDKAGKVTGSTGGQERAISLASVKPRTSESDAVATASALMTTITETSGPELVVYAEGTPHLAWETVLSGTREASPSKLTVWTDAVTGAVVSTSELVVHGTGSGYFYPGVAIGTSGGGSSYSMTDTARPGLKCGGQNGAAYTGADDVWGNGSGTNLETACVDVLYGAGKEIDMLAAWLNRSGIKGNGSSYPARVGLNDVNAYFDGTIINVGHSSDNARQLTAIDIVAHENGHGVFQTTPGASTGGNETGGMNEASSDIFGALTEAYAANPSDPADFLVGEEADLVGQGPIRNMYNPAALGDPACYSPAISTTEVHAAAGPLNHWFYLLSQGSAGSSGSPASPTCNGSTLTGVGIQAAGKIFYEGLLLKTSSWTHPKARIATLTAAKNLYGSTDCTTFAKVKAAWDAISVPAQSGEPSCGTAGGGGTCTKVSATGTLTNGATSFQPSATGFTSAAGTLRACLTGPSSADFDLFLQKRSGSSWSTVGRSEGSTSTEAITYTAAAGTYRWAVLSYSGSGSFTLKYDTP
ncbi:MAG: M4 family metallopeptidase [Nocardioides sp.]|nr:M4 family metallopeptidase [Nocardioides sp.]